MNIRLYPQWVWLHACYGIFTLTTLLAAKVPRNVAELPDTSEPLVSIVTYEKAPGRLGDQLIGYMHARWVAYKYNLPFYYQPFPYSDQLMMHVMDQKYHNGLLAGRKKLTFKHTDRLETFVDISKKGIIYNFPYFPESLEEFQPTSGPDFYHIFQRPIEPWSYFAVDWQDQQFKKLLQAVIAPIQPLNLVKLPSKAFTIAIQVRKNSGGFDRPLLHGLSEHEYNPKQLYVDVVFPLKHPPEDYYIEQLKYVLKKCQYKNIYVYLFTDDPQPVMILERFKQAVQDSRVKFDCRHATNNHYSNVLEDLFSMMRFDCLIRPDSNLSIVASKIGVNKIVIWPAHHHWEGRTLIIDQVNIQGEL